MSIEDALRINREEGLAAGYEAAKRDRDLVPAEAVHDARAAGYADAVAKLRDRAAYDAWMKADMESDNPGLFWPYAEAAPRFADYLETHAPKEQS